LTDIELRANTYDASDGFEIKISVLAGWDKNWDKSAVICLIERR